MSGPYRVFSAAKKQTLDQEREILSMSGTQLNNFTWRKHKHVVIRIQKRQGFTQDILSTRKGGWYGKNRINR